MELELHRTELVQSAAAAKGTLRVLPSGKNKQQKIAAGDSTGVLHIFNVKKGGIETAFKSLPMGQGISCVTHGLGETQRDKVFLSFGRTVQGLSKKGKEFYRFATGLGEDIKRVAVKDLTLITAGEQGSTIFSNNEEKSHWSAQDRVTVMEGVDLAAAILPPTVDAYGRLIKASKSAAAAAAATAAAMIPVTPVLGTFDGRLVALDEDSRVAMQIQMNGPINALAYLPDSSETLPGSKHAGRREILIATARGELAQVFLDHAEGMIKGWSSHPLEDAVGGGGGPAALSPHLAASPIVAITSVDLNRDGIDEVVIARESGLLQVFTKDAHDALLPDPIRNVFLEESVSTLQKGYVTQSSSEEIVVQTSGGRILTLGMEDGAGMGVLLGGNVHGGGVAGAAASSKAADKFRGAVGKLGKAQKALAAMQLDGPGSGGGGSALPPLEAPVPGALQPSRFFGRPTRDPPPPDKSSGLLPLTVPLTPAAQLESLRSEVAQLESHLRQRKIQLQVVRAGGDPNSADAAANAAAMMIQSVTQVQMSATLERESGIINFSIESSTTIELISIASMIVLDIMEAELGQWSLTRSRTIAAQGQAQFSYVFRPTDQTSKLLLKVRPTEGQAGEVTFFIMPKADPCCFRIIKHVLPPLSLHLRAPTPDDQRPLNELRITGPFSMGDMHVWLTLCFEGSGARMPMIQSQNGESTLCFENVILGTQVSARYADGFGHFFSDNISTLAILRERIAQEASKMGLRGLNIQVKPLADAAVHVITNFWPRLNAVREAVYHAKLVDALKEIQLAEDDVSFLDDKYRNILNRADVLKMTAKQSEAQLIYLQGILRDLFIDYHKLSTGSESSSKVRELDDLMTADELEMNKVTALFKEQKVLQIGGARTGGYNISPALHVDDELLSYEG